MTTSYDLHARVHDAGSQRSLRSVVFASTIGTIIEWYDFLIYGMAAALVFNKLFFPSIDPLLGTLAALGSYAVGFLARPLGGAIFGYFGDRLGRKSILMLTLVMMGLGTFLIGVLPTYAQIGIWAPILLISLRFIQGIGLGGEWGGASVMVLEHAPKEHRGLYGSLVQVGFPIGLVVATLVFGVIAKLPEADILAWGWRVPFLISAVLILLGMFIRSNVSESPVFEEMKARREIVSNPVKEAIFKHPRSFLVAVGLKISEVSWVYMLTVFVVVYATGTLKLPKSMILDAILVAAAVELITIPLFGFLSDRIGRRPLYFIGAIFTLAFAFPLFWLLEMRTPEIVMLTIVVAMSLGHGLMFAPESTYFPELFGANVRYSGASFGFQVAAALGGGFAPVLATALAGYMGGTAGVSVMLIVLALITLVAAMFARETRNEALLK
ncbi:MULTISPECIES: MFS transporter [Herbaspirillum]|uniref:MFS transporter n=1 Tax=Herbaspirillum TaxID=963 RepID=UPI001F51F274|nr:MFS transporter [Herbaspirillum sp. C7C2]MCI1013225.1 MHS family MFS transporter [Herbaspirillum sp. C7C2]